jgi:hypothetical protein
MTEDERRRAAADQFLDALAKKTEHREITNVQAFREMLEAAVAVYDGTEDQRVADWARNALRAMDERAGR